jgi:thiamine pyrophosphokinase
MGNIEYSETVILANGSFPFHEIPVAFLRNASRIICCDGAAQSLIEYGIEPFAIVGDCDSLDPGISEKFNDRIFIDSESCSFKSFPGQQVSFFSISPETEITSSGLLYPLKKRKLKNWWEATLNEAAGNSFSLVFESGEVIVFLKFME